MMPKGNEKRETQQNTLLYRRQEAKKATKIEEIPKIRCLSRLVKREKATKKGKPSKIRCLYRRQEAKKATKNREIPEIRCLSRLVKREKATKKGKSSKIRCLYRQQEAKKATKSEKIPEIRCPTHAFPKKARSEKATTPKRLQTKGPKQQGSRTLVRLPYSIFSQQLLLTIFFQNLLNSFGWIQQVCDG